MKAEQPGAPFEISVDGKPRSYLDTKMMADQAAAVLKTKHRNSDVVVRDIRARRPSDPIPLRPPDAGSRGSST
jgi:hypothetical protein